MGLKESPNNTQNEPRKGQRNSGRWWGRGGGGRGRGRGGNGDKNANTQNLITPKPPHINMETQSPDDPVKEAALVPHTGYMTGTEKIEQEKSERRMKE